jgi:predicted CxxxxCH...CXXCH cytochrome family protein
MNKKFYKFLLAPILLLFFTVVVFYGCSKQADNLVMTQSTSIFHGDGWLTPTASNFHGNVIRTTYGWKMDNCKSCHGNDYKGGNTQTSCFTCHQNGPEGCNVCHGNTQHIYPPKSLAGHLLPTEQGVGAHDIHMNSDSTVRYSAQVSCFECHLQINGFSDTNHIGFNPGFAEVIFGTLAKKVTTGFTPIPVWNASNQTCANTYCHGYFKGGNPTALPVFNNPNSAGCGSCHGNPTTGNPKPVTGHQYYPDQCWYCHGAVIDSNNVIINKYRHVNGVIDYNVDNK